MKKISTIRRNMLMITLGGGLLAYGIQRLFIADRPTAEQLLQKRQNFVTPQKLD